MQSEDFQIIECVQCKIAFTNPPPVMPDYINMDFHSGENKDNADKLTYLNDLHQDWQMLIKLQIKMIEEQFNKNATILEIGCGEGILLDELRKAGFQNLEGIEPSRAGFHRAIKKGLNVSNLFFDGGVTDKYFNLVIMSHVFEHIEDPYPFLEKVKSVLNPGGAIMMTQTNFKAIMPRFLKDNWYAWAPDQHFWHFTPSGLKIMFNQNGLNTNKVNYCTLVHPKSRLNNLARKFPFLQDQFIIMAKMR